MATTTKQVAEIGDIAVTISTAQTDLRRVQEYLENRLSGRQDVQSIAHQLLEGLAVTQRRLGVARVQCLLLSATDDAVREAQAAAEQFGLLH